MFVRTSALDDVRLSHALMQSHWHRNDVAETATLDQLRAYLAEDPQDRGKRLTLLLLSTTQTFAAAIARHDGAELDVWINLRIPAAPRADTEAFEVVCDALEDERRFPGSAKELVALWLLDADVDGALRLVREAAWVAATICWPS